MKNITFGENNRSEFRPHIIEGADAAVYAIDNFGHYIRQKYKIKRSYDNIIFTNSSDT